MYRHWPPSYMDSMDDVPLFMRELPSDAEDNVALQALQSLVYEGTPEGTSHVSF